MPCVTSTVTKMHFVGSNIQVYYDSLHIRLTFQAEKVTFQAG